MLILSPYVLFLHIKKTVGIRAIIANKLAIGTTQFSRYIIISLLYLSCATANLNSNPPPPGYQRPSSTNLEL
jgi:hypothetical protein